MLEAGYVFAKRYQLQEKLGQDVSRQTWLAVDIAKQPQQQVVVKLLTLTPQLHWDECKLFEREAQVLKNLNHPRIPKYRDYFLLEHQPGSRFPWFGLVQSYIPGVSLLQLLNQGKRFSAVQVEKIAVEVLSILVYLHELNPPVLHRDIKPSNLIWGEDERVYLVDFGAVQDQAVLEGATFTVVGTYGYVPMEQFAGRAVQASDLYALGATLIHLLTGTPPADLPHPDSRIQFVDRVSVDLGFVNWIGKLTEPNLAQRLSTARQALAALENKNTLSPPITTSKPRGSQILLKKSANTLEIKIPRRGGKALKSMYLLGLLSFSSYFLPTLFQMISDIISSLLTSESEIVPYQFLFLGSIALFLAFPLLYFIVMPAFQQTDLYFDREYFQIRLKLFGLCYWWVRGKTALIKNVYEKVVDDNSKPRGVVIETSDPTLDIGSPKYSSSPISTVERQWLIQEIKDWLGLEKQFSNQNVDTASIE